MEAVLFVHRLPLCHTLRAAPCIQTKYTINMRLAGTVVRTELQFRF